MNTIPKKVKHNYVNYTNIDIRSYFSSGFFSPVEKRVRKEVVHGKRIHNKQELFWYVLGDFYHKTGFLKCIMKSALNLPDKQKCSLLLNNENSASIKSKISKMFLTKNTKSLTWSKELNRAKFGPSIPEISFLTNGRRHLTGDVRLASLSEISIRDELKFSLRYDNSKPRHTHYVLEEFTRSHISNITTKEYNMLYNLDVEAHDCTGFNVQGCVEVVLHFSPNCISLKKIAGGSRKKVEITKQIARLFNTPQINIKVESKIRASIHISLFRYVIELDLGEEELAWIIYNLVGGPKDKYVPKKDRSPVFPFVKILFFRQAEYTPKVVKLSRSGNIIRSKVEKTTMEMVSYLRKGCLGPSYFPSLKLIRQDLFIHDLEFYLHLYDYRDGNENQESIDCDRVSYEILTMLEKLRIRLDTQIIKISNRNKSKVYPSLCLNVEVVYTLNKVW